MGMFTCPYCSIEITLQSVEAEDGHCPECGAIITAGRPSYSDDENEEEVVEEEEEEEEEEKNFDFDEKQDEMDIFEDEIDEKDMRE